MDFTGLLPVLEKRARKVGDATVVLRDNLHVTTWVCIGAAIQSLAFLAIGRLALLPAVGVLIYRMLDTYAMTTGLKHNHYMDDVIREKFSAQFPDSQGRYGNKASNSDVAVLMIGTQSNHPMGLLAPGFKELGDYFQTMTKELEDNASQTGFLGITSFIGTSRSTKNQLMNIMYFTSADAVHAFAHGATHRAAWDWWNRIWATHPHLAIYHELYHVPRGYWESIYQQVKPLGMAATMHRVQSEGEGEGERWMSPVVDARKGVLKSSAGRMGKDLSSEKE